MSEKEKFLGWLRDQEENHGLKEIRIYPNRSALSADPRLFSHLLEDEELFYKELNEMNKAESEGRYTEILYL